MVIAPLRASVVGSDLQQPTSRVAVTFVPRFFYPFHVQFMSNYIMLLTVLKTYQLFWEDSSKFTTDTSCAWLAYIYFSEQELT